MKNKFWKGLKTWYFEGIEWMKIGEGLPGVMYLATTIMEIFILCKLIPENAMQYTKILGINLFLVYLYSIVINQFNQNRTVRFVQRLGFVGIALFVGFTIARGLNFMLLFALFVVPIIVALATIYVEENYVGVEDFINPKNISNFKTVLLTTLIPVITITVPLIFLEWNILVKIAIVVTFVLIAPFIYWLDANGYGIFGAMGIEW